MRRRAGSDVRLLGKVIGISEEIFSGIPRDRFLSPFSVIPLIAQVVGLSAPLPGTGGSRYSIFNYINELADKRHLFQKAFEIPFEQKRLIVDELYEAVSPCLLEEQDEYIDLCAATCYSGADRKVLKDKMKLISGFISRFSGNGGSGRFAHIAHYGYLADLNRECSFIGSLPVKKAETWFRHSYPIVNELAINHNGEEYAGWIIFVPNSTEQLLRDGTLRKRKIIQAAQLAGRLGAGLAAMGGLVASFAQGGQFMSEQVPGVGFTTGHAYTIGNILRIADLAAERVELDMRRARIAVVGAAGSIGSGCAKLLAQRGVIRLILVEMLSFASQKKLEDVRGALLKINPRIDAVLSVQADAIKNADMIIVATNSPTSVIPARHLKKGAIIIDDSFPKNVSRATFERRGDIILLEGGAVRLPLTVDINAARNMPDLMDAPLTRLISCKEVYGCFAEVLTLAMTGHQGVYGLGPADPDLANDIMQRADRIGFQPAPLQCFDQLISDERYERVSGLIRKRGLSLRHVLRKDTNAS